VKHATKFSDSDLVEIASIIHFAEGARQQKGVRINSGLAADWNPESVSTFFKH